MVRGKTSKRSEAKTILRLPDLEQSKNAVPHSLAASSRKNHTAMPSTNSSGGTVRNRVWHLTEPSSFATDSSSKASTSGGFSGRYCRS